MKATGVVRRIDDLGRIVIPKEVRRVLGIRDGDPLEIFTGDNGEVTFKKYSPIANLNHCLLEICADSLRMATGQSVMITDTDCVLIHTGNKSTISNGISKDLKERLNMSYAHFSRSNESCIPLMVIDPKDKYVSQIIEPIKSEGDILGFIVVYSCIENIVSESCKKLISMTAHIIGQQMSK